MGTTTTQNHLSDSAINNSFLDKMALVILVFLLSFISPNIADIGDCEFLSRNSVCPLTVENVINIGDVQL